MLRDVSREDFVQAVRNSGPAMPSLPSRLDLLEQSLPDPKKGNVLDLTYVPGLGTLARGQGQEMMIPGTNLRPR